jgi:hypothetical protein
MRSEGGLLATVVGVVLLAGAFYVVLRWILQPLLLQLTAGVDLVIDLVGALLLMPEFVCTCLLRRVIRRPAPFAFVYGDAVGGAACMVRGMIHPVVTALQAASLKVGHRESVIGAVLGALAVVLL